MEGRFLAIPSEKDPRIPGNLDPGQFSGRRLRLASASERRLTLLRQVGLDPEVWPTTIDESVFPDEDPEAYVARMALTKARAAFDPEPDHLVLGADTAVVCDREILGKPAGPEEAMAMLARLSGRTHRVLTAIAVCTRNHPEGVVQVVTSRVAFKSLTRAEITAYVATGEPLDKAGSYGIQGIGAFLVCHLEGSYSGVVGLPLFETLELLRNLGLTFPGPE
ncbi:MAG: septum formation inhibitor Maf [Magnetococcales bacterium]|nr:septum formation inhibitor Maf [Magnetococcales bacterium]